MVVGMEASPRLLSGEDDDLSPAKHLERCYDQDR